MENSICEFATLDLFVSGALKTTVLKVTAPNDPESYERSYRDMICAIAEALDQPPDAIDLSPMIWLPQPSPKTHRAFRVKCSDQTFPIAYLIERSS